MKVFTPDGDVDTDHEGGLLLGVGHHPACVHRVKRHLDSEEKNHSTDYNNDDGTRTDGSHIRSLSSILSVIRIKVKGPFIVYVI